MNHSKTMINLTLDIIFRKLLWILLRNKSYATKWHQLSFTEAILSYVYVDSQGIGIS